jgi:hypothetical protein
MRCIRCNKADSEHLWTDGIQPTPYRSPLLPGRVYKHFANLLLGGLCDECALVLERCYACNKVRIQKQSVHMSVRLNSGIKYFWHTCSTCEEHKFSVGEISEDTLNHIRNDEGFKRAITHKCGRKKVQKMRVASVKELERKMSDEEFTVFCIMNE